MAGGTDDGPDGRDRDAAPADGPLGFGEGDGPATPPRAAHDPDRYAHRRDPDAEAYGLTADRPPAPPRLPPGASRYTWFIGVVAVLVIAYVTVNSVTTEGPGSRGAATGIQAPPFAAPLATSALEGDVNVARQTGQGGEAGDVAACSIHRPDVLTICDVYKERPVILAFFATRGKECANQLDTLQRISARRSDVAIAGISIRGDRGDVRDLVRKRGWTFPVGYDKDGILSTLYNVVICPELTYIYKGGKVAGTSFGEKGAPELGRRMDALVAGRPLPPEA